MADTNLIYVEQAPDIVRVNVENLRVGFVHVCVAESGLYELARIHEIAPEKNRSITFRFGYVGYASRTELVGSKVDVLRESMMPISKVESD